MKHKPYGYIYLVNNTSNAKCYVGKTTKTIQERWKGHIQESNKPHDGSYLHKAMGKYGCSFFNIRAVDMAMSRKELNAKEELYISLLDTTHHQRGYNLTSGGDGVTMTPEIRRKIGRGNTGKIRTQKVRNSMSLAFLENYKTNPNRAIEIRTRVTGCGNPFYGKHHSKESIYKMSKAQMGKVYSIETREKVGSAAKKMWADPEFKAKLSAKRKALWGDPIFKANALAARARTREDKRCA